MKSINLYTIAIMDNMKFYPLYYSSLTDENVRYYKPHEANSLKVLVEEMIKKGAEVKEFDNFFLGFTIPQIGKEFDTIKISPEIILNVELKSYISNIEDVKEQLIKNKFYLAHLGGKHYFYTFNSNDKKVYKLDDNNNLVSCDIEEIVAINKNIKNADNIDIEKLFSVSQFILSPINNTEKFLKGEYFLTQQQQIIKKKIINSVYGKKSSVVKLSGSPGTGKTLLLYDICLTLAHKRSICFVIWGKKKEAHYIIEKLTKNVVFKEISKLKSEDLEDFDLIITDETQRYTEKEFEKIVNFTRKRGNRGIIAFEKQDINFDNSVSLMAKRMKSVRGANYILSGRIRINEQLSSFISHLFDKGSLTKKWGYNAVNCYFSNNNEQTKELVKLSFNNGYSYIATEKERKYQNYIDVYDCVGREFEKALVIIGDNYFYNKDGKLSYNGAFPEKLYHAITRARGEIAIIVEKNWEIFQHIMQLKVKK